MVIKVLFVCHGNICRSPMCKFVFKDMVEKMECEKGIKIKDRFYISSAATSTEEIWGGVGNPIYPPAKAELKKRGIGSTPYTDFSGKRARQVTRKDYEEYDYILCADSANIRNTTRITGGDPEGKIKLLLDYTDRAGDSIADPWYSGDFVTTYEDIIYGLNGFMDHLRSKGQIP